MIDLFGLLHHQVDVVQDTVDVDLTVGEEIPDLNVVLADGDEAADYVRDCEELGVGQVGQGFWEGVEQGV